MTCQRRHPHDGRNAARYYHPAPGAMTAVLCDGCVARLNLMGMDWHCDSRTDPARAVKGPAWRRLPAKVGWAA